MRAKQHRVTAGYVTVETAVAGGRANVDVPRGSLLPPDVPQAQIDHELSLGTIVEEYADVTESPSDQDGGGSAGDSGAGDGDDGQDDVKLPEVPAGMSVSATQEWVGSDALKAQAALVAEQASASPRSTLVARLEAVIAAAAEGATGADPSPGA
jgi:hypothetical protein